MQRNDIPQFIHMLNSLCETYGKAKFSDEAAMLQFSVLQDYPLEDVRSGYLAALRNPDSGQFMPRPADVIRELEGSSETRACIAWSKVRKAMERIGCMHSLVFDDPIIHAVVSDMGGLANLFLMTNEELPFRERDFLRIYRSYIGRTLAHYPRYLAGKSETENYAKGYAVEPPMMVGDTDKAEQVFLGGSDKPRLAVQPMHSFPALCGELADLYGANDDGSSGGAA